MDTQQVQLLFVDLAVIIVLAAGAGRLAVRLGQPPVIGEITVGVALGTALPLLQATDRVLPPDVRTVLAGLAAVGVAWFMFAIGLELDADRLRSRARSVASVATWSMVGAFTLGVLTAVPLLHRHPTATPVLFAAFLGLAMSVTAFPVLARILADRGLLRTTVGELALSTAAFIDVIAWTGLSLVLAVSRGEDSWSVLLVVPYVATMFLVVRPLLVRLLRPADPERETAPHATVVLFGLALLSGAATEAIGLHFIFGAFLAGLVVNLDAAPALRESLCERAEKLSAPLLPVYFLMAGLSLGLGSLQLADLAEALLLLTVAVVGKVGVAYAVGRLRGMTPPDAVLLGVLLNTRGLTELIVLGAGYGAGLIDRSLYAMMMFVAVVTTAMTGPLITLLQRVERRRTGPGRLGTPASEGNPSTRSGGSQD